jgi:TrmH family RNA methyltransferase
VIDGVEKPGNIGAIFRTAEAAGVDAVICCDIPGDLFNPNTIRASLGTIFSIPIVMASGDEVRVWLKSKKIKCFCSYLHKSNDYSVEDYTGATAIVMGTESVGISQEWLDFSDQVIKIPMRGKIDSMNVSVAAAVLIFEAIRQRNN